MQEMQDDLQAIGGGGGRLFGGGGGGDRRLRPQSQHNNHQALKCPRCDSLNTKFCYYNNYNLSQPRHFCKSCRRYWTKGGVLRNVPVGGGCRKNKRSKPKSASSSDTLKERKSNSHSSSESSSLTATTTAATTTTAAATAAAAEVASASSSTSGLLNFQDSSFFIHPQSTAAAAGFDPTLIEQSSDGNAGLGGGGIFPEIGSFTSLMTSSNDHHQQPPLLGFSLADISSFRPMVQNQSNNQLWQHQQKVSSTSVEDDLKMPEMTAGFLDQSAQIELSGLQNRTSNGGLASLDWQSGGEQELFDFTGTVDQAYWSQAQWSTDNDHSLNYLP